MKTLSSQILELCVILVGDVSIVESFQRAVKTALDWDFEAMSNIIQA